MGRRWLPGRRPRRGAAALGAVISLLAVSLGADLANAAPARADVVRNTEMWVLNELDVQPAWKQTQGQHVVVAVIDSGVNPGVSDLTGAVQLGPDLTGVHTPPSDPHWGIHGTWMASLIVGHGHAGGSSGIIGVAPQARVLSIRVITDSSDPNYAAYQRQSASNGQHELAQAINYAVQHGAGVISMSLGYQAQSLEVRQALQNAFDHSVVVVASAGNSGNPAALGGKPHAQAPYSFPADYPGVLAVGAVNSAGQVATFSSTNISVQVAAPGYNVPAQGRDGQYWLVSGTSPACALTAGVVALLKSRYPHLTDSQVIGAITSSTTDRPPRGYNDKVGFGVVDAAAALTAAGKLATAGPPPVGMVAAGHFGGGFAAIPPPPVAPRGPLELILFCLLGAACLGLVAVSTSKILAAREIRTAAAVAAAAAAGSPADVAGPPASAPAAGPPASAATAGLPAPAGGAVAPSDAEDAAGPPPAGRHAATRRAGDGWAQWR